MSTAIKTPDAAVCHLFLYCCFKDGEVKEQELDNLAGKFASLNMQQELNFKDEMIAFRQDRQLITDEDAYLTSLINAINPTNEAALFSYCMELMLSDELLDTEEDLLLNRLAVLLSINQEVQAAIRKLIIQRKVVSTQKFF